MHEYPITMEIIRIAEVHAKKHNAAAVTRIDLVIGDYSGYLADSILLYFDIIAKDTMCKDAKLSIEHIAPKLRCEGCRRLFPRMAFNFTCPYCNEHGSPTDIGREFYIKSIEVEEIKYGNK